MFGIEKIQREIKKIRADLQYVGIYEEDNRHTVSYEARKSIRTKTPIDRTEEIESLRSRVSSLETIVECMQELLNIKEESREASHVLIKGTKEVDIPKFKVIYESTPFLRYPFGPIC